jgi:hypothetical protein
MGAPTAKGDDSIVLPPVRVGTDLQAQLGIEAVRVATRRGRQLGREAFT